MITPNPKKPKNQATNTVFCTKCPRFRSPDRQRVVEHLMKVHGYSREAAQREF